MASMTRNEQLLAVGLEVGPGTFLQTFGVGHMYAGRWSAGVAIMVSYWVLQAINGFLVPFGIGIVTGFLTWLAYMVLVPTDLLGSAPRR